MDKPFLVQTIAKPINTPRLNRGAPAPKAKSLSDQIVQFHRSNSSPALWSEEIGIVEHDLPEPKHRYETTTPNIICLTILAFLLYIIIGVAVYLFTPGMFRGQQTLKLVDALYFTFAALCKVGYGDIVPNTTFSKLFTSIFILVGFGFIGFLLNGLVIYVLDRLEKVLHIKDEERGRMRVKFKICLALGVIFVCLAIGTVIIHLIEKLNWVDSFYLSVASVTTVSYGDYAFKTVAGRCFAIIWLLSSTLAVVRAFLYLAEYRIERRKHKLARNILQRRLTFEDRVAADMNRDGFISKAEYVVFKLKEIGKIAERDVQQICKRFDSSENVCNGKIKV